MARRRGFVARRLERSRATITLLRAAFGEFQRDYARYFAIAMVYYSLIALVPLVLLLLAALGWFLRLSELAAPLAEQTLAGVESNFGLQLRSAIEQMLVRIEDGSAAATIVSIGGLVLTSSVLFAHLRITFRAVWKVPPPLASGNARGAILDLVLEKTVAFVMVLAGVPLLLAVLVALAILHGIGGWLSGIPVFGGPLGAVLALSTPLLFVPVVFGLLFRYLPPVRLRWKDISFSVVLCSMAWMVGAELLVLYAVYFGHNVSAYGALGGALVLMLWIKTMSQVLFFGAELCKVSSQRRAGHDLKLRPA